MDFTSERDGYWAGSAYDYDAIEMPPVISDNERRLHVRAYNHWASMIGYRKLPSIADLKPETIEPFAAKSVLLDFTSGLDQPKIAYLGADLRRECGIDGEIKRLEDLPADSLLHHVASEYMQIIETAAPVTFQAEFVNQRGATILYRGILMPYSSDDETIDYIYGVINWKEQASDALISQISDQIAFAMPSLSPQTGAPAPDMTAIWNNSPHASEADFPRIDGQDEGEDALLLSDDMALGATHAYAEDDELLLTLSMRLETVRASIQNALACDARSRTALYQAISDAYDFALAARDAQEDYQLMLAAQDIKAQARAPMTAMAKLLFGVHYDKTRLTEVATALDYAMSRELPAGTLANELAHYAGGLKGLVADMRAARRIGAAKTKPKTTVEGARAKLIQAAPIDSTELVVDADGLAVAIVRRDADGGLTIIGALDTEQKAAQQAIIEASRQQD